jgi:hypothetical protein
MTDTATTPVDFTHDELIALAYILGRVADGARTGTYQPLRDAALFTSRGQFATALDKINDAALATVSPRRTAARTTR